MSRKTPSDRTERRSATDNNPGGSALGALWRYSRRRRGQVLLASLHSVLNKFFDLAPPVLIGAAVDVVVNREASFLARWGISDPWLQLLGLAGATTLIWILESLFEYLYGVAWRNLAQALQHDLRMDAYRKIQDLDMAFFEDRHTGGLLSILNDDVNQLERFLDGGANEILQVLTTVLVVSALFFGISPGLAGLSLAPIPFILWGSLVFQKRIAPRYQAVREQVGVLNARLANNLSGISTVKSYHAEEFETGRIEAVSREYQEVNRRAIRLSAAFIPLIRMVIMAGFIAILVLGARSALAGELNVGLYSVMVFMIQRLLWPLTRLGSTLDLYQRAMASTRRILDLLARTPQVKNGVLNLDGVEPLAAPGEIVFENIHFAYADGPPVLRGLDFRVPGGSTLAVVGSTGSGKTTLVKLLQRFYDPGAGRILVEGRDIRELDSSTLRRAMGLVSQDVYLFDGTVEENIAYGSPGADSRAIEKAARLAEAHDFIESLPRGYSTLVGERGQKLSGGQRQRISLARAILKNPRILILDEATSSVDNETEAAIQKSLRTLEKDRTTLIIAHRLSTVRHAARILVLDQGRVAESGTHEELLVRGGLYARLWKVQTGEAALDDHPENLDSVRAQLEGHWAAQLREKERLLNESVQQVHEAQEQLIIREKMAVLGGLVAGVAHEINTPLGMCVTSLSHFESLVSALGEEFREKRLTEEYLQRYLADSLEVSQILTVNVLRASELIRSFKQISADQSSNTPRIINLAEYLGEILTSLHPQLKKKAIDVELDIPPDLVLSTYPSCFSQIFSNLILNSLNHGFEAKESGKIRIRATVAASRTLLKASADGRGVEEEQIHELRLEYRDDGQGMDSEACGRIFEPFYTTKRHEGGTGLGTYIVYNLVTQKLQGRIQCESKPGEGLAYVMEFPVMPRDGFLETR